MLAGTDGFVDVAREKVVESSVVAAHVSHMRINPRVVSWPLVTQKVETVVPVNKREEIHLRVFTGK